LKPIILQQSFAFIMVKYPYRRSPDLYVVAAGHPAFCAQCEAQFKVPELINHIHSHDRRKGKAEILSMKDGKIGTVVEIREIEGSGKNA